MEREVLTVIFQQPADFLAQASHLAMGALFVLAPERLPAQFAEVVLRVETRRRRLEETRLEPR